MEELNGIRWLKSSYSGGSATGGGGNCVEVAGVWLKSSYSGGNSGGGGGNCVEIAAAGARRAVRDSKNPSGPALVFTGAAWDAFVASVKRGDLNA
jgi:Domain of unknown function (DUF397)